MFLKNNCSSFKNNVEFVRSVSFTCLIKGLQKVSKLNWATLKITEARVGVSLGTKLAKIDDCIG